MFRAVCDAAKRKQREREKANLSCHFKVYKGAGGWGGGGWGAGGGSGLVWSGLSSLSLS